MLVSTDMRPSGRQISVPSTPTIVDGEAFRSPATSESTESGIDLKYYGPLQIPKFSLNGSSDMSMDGANFLDPTQSSFNSNNKVSGRRKTAWETVYASQEGRKIVKYTFQGSVYNFLERPRGWKSYAYHCGILLAVMACLMFSVVTSIADDGEGYCLQTLFAMEIILVIILAVEYSARIWSAGCRSKYLGWWGRFRFATKPISIIDLVIILASLFVIIFGSNGHMFAASAIRGVRFLQILRMLHMDRQGGSWRLLGSVIYMHRQELLTSLYIGFLGLIFSSYFMYLVEKDAIIDSQPSNFATYADAVWWGVVTMMTIGYGDKVPQTWAGRALACVCAMFTVSFFALPAGILGSGFALKVQQQQRQKHFSRQIPAAATLIQCLWRCYAADKRFASIATWDIHLKVNDLNTTSKFKPLGGLRLRKPKKSLADLGRGTYTSTNTVKNKITNGRNSYEDIIVDLNVPRPPKTLHHSRSVPDMMIVVSEDPFYSSSKSGEKRESVFRSPGESICDTTSEDNDIFVQETSRITVLTEAHKNAIRAIRKIKYFVAKRKFQQARKPYDVGDVIEQYSQGQLSMMVRIKELQRRLDYMLGKPSHGEKSGKPVTIGNKLNHLDHQVQRLEKKLDNINFLLHSLMDNITHQQKAIEAPK